MTRENRDTDDVRRFLEATTAGKWLVEDKNVVAAAAVPVLKGRAFVIVGTSGSTDYLKDTTGDRRYWPVVVPTAPTAPLSQEAHARLDALIAAGPLSTLITVEPGCDGVHVDGAPSQHLCTRCYPDPRGDLPAQEDEAGEDDRRDPAQEME